MKGLRKQDGTPKTVRFDKDDEEILNECCRAEKLSFSDVLRRALRAYAKQLGIETAKVA
jgi:hypothetical protein